MRFVFAIISFVFAAVLITAGITQRTIFAEPDRAMLSTSVPTDAVVTVIDGAALDAYQGNQSLKVSGSPTIVAAYGRTTDVIAWVGDTTYNWVGFNPKTKKLTNSVVSGSESTIPNLSGSDLWLDQFEAESTLFAKLNAPPEFSFVMTSIDGLPAPQEITITWPVNGTTGWSGALIVSGAVVLLLGLLFLLWAISHMRKLRGPRRKQLKMPKVPKKPRYKTPRRGVEGSRARRSLGRGMFAAPLAVLSTLMLASCTAGAAPSGDIAADSTPGSSSSAELRKDLPPAVTVSQVKRIVAEISKTAEQADAAKDTTLLATRFGGAAYELREANYAITTADPTLEALQPIPAGPVKLTLPQQTESWPRAVFAVIQDDADQTIPSMALMLEQQDARSQYKVMYAMTLEPSQKIPDVAQAEVGTARLLPSSSVLRFDPDKIALAYGDILENDTASEAYTNFEAEGDSFRVSVGAAYKQAKRSELPSTATMYFAHEIGKAESISLATNDAGALVAVNLNERTIVTPTEEGAAVNTAGAVKALSGLAVSSKGIQATYSDQLLFFVPPAGSDKKIVLLGFAQGLVRAGEAV
ncbi:MAG: hypothetical protein ACRCSP_03680 [Rhodoglobus sp.]